MFVLIVEEEDSAEDSDEDDDWDDDYDSDGEEGRAALDESVCPSGKWCELCSDAVL